MADTLIPGSPRSATGTQAPKPGASAPDSPQSESAAPITDALEELTQMSRLAVGHLFELIQIQKDSWRIATRRAILSACAGVGIGLTGVAVLVSAITILMQALGGALNQWIQGDPWAGPLIVSSTMIVLIALSAWVVSRKLQRTALVATTESNHESSTATDNS